MYKLNHLITSAFIICFAGAMLSCGSKTGDSTVNSISNKEKQAVEYVKNNLKNEYELIDYQIISEGQLPLIISDEFDNYDKNLFREKLDYDLYEKRKKNPRTEFPFIESLQSEIKERYSELEQKRSNKEYLLVLGTLKKDDGLKIEFHKTLVALNPENYSDNKWIRVNNNLIKKTAIVASALDNNLTNYTIYLTPNLDSLAKTVSDPVMRFILEPIKE